MDIWFIIDVCAGLWLYCQGTLWGNAMEDLRTLTPSCWVGIGILDLYLSHQCVALGDLHNITYVRQTLVHLDLGPPNWEEIAQFTQQNDVEHVQDRIYLFVRWEAGHYFLVLFDYAHRRVIAFGRNYSAPTAIYCETAGWDLWNGPSIWARIGALAGIEQYDELPVVSSYDWTQVCFSTQ